jgi:hypothetical protein
VWSWVLGGDRVGAQDEFVIGERAGVVMAHAEAWAGGVGSEVGRLIDSCGLGEKPGHFLEDFFKPEMAVFCAADWVVGGGWVV